MVGSGVPDELPIGVTREGVLKEARKRQANLIGRLGERLGIAALGERAQSTGLQRSSDIGSIKEAKMLKKQKRELGFSKRPFFGIPGLERNEDEVS